ncbi:MAG: DNA-3-methyladenine glycosylase family protein [Solirubrobacteraceae bacterium]
MPEPARWTAAIKLTGAGGEPVDFARTLLSHGVADLPPNVIRADGSRLQTVLPAAGRAWVVQLTAPRSGRAVAGTPGGATSPSGAAGESLLAQLRLMLRLDEDLSPFYRLADADPALAWVGGGAGRMLRSPTVFEEVVKTICTTNCAWSGTQRMVGALVGELGRPAEGAPALRAFPTPQAMAEADDSFYRDVARAGYRGAYLRMLAADVAEGRLDLECFNDPSIADDEVAERLLEIAGVGPYAMAHVMMLIGRYRRLVLDSWTRPKYRRLTGRARVTDKGIVRAFGRYREFAGLAFWLTLTEDWLAQDEVTAAEDEPRPPRIPPPDSRR